MAVRQVKKEKKNKTLRSEKASNAKRSGPPRSISPKNPSNAAQALAEGLEVLSPVILMPGMDELYRADSATSNECRRRSVVSSSAATLLSDDTGATINSLHPSPLREAVPIEEDNFAREEEDEEDEEDDMNVFEEEPRQSGFFSRIFGGFFRRRECPVPPPPALNGFLEGGGGIRQCPPVLEVIHVFQNATSALGHEGLMKRSKRRMARASIRRDGEVIDVGEDIESQPVSSLPPNEKVVLLRQVLSPRDQVLSQDVILDKASHRPDLWVFLPYSYCKNHYPSELLDYLSRRCAWPESSTTSPVRQEAVREEEEEEEEEGEEEMSTLVAPHHVLQSNRVPSTPPEVMAPESNDNGTKQPLETPLMNFSPREIPPNSIDAPLRRHAPPREIDIPTFTPLALPTPPQTLNKSQDRRVAAEAASDVDVVAPSKGKSERNRKNDEDIENEAPEV